VIKEHILSWYYYLVAQLFDYLAMANQKILPKFDLGNLDPDFVYLDMVLSKATLEQFINMFRYVIINPCVPSQTAYVDPALNNVNDFPKKLHEVQEFVNTTTNVIYNDPVERMQICEKIKKLYVDIYSGTLDFDDIFLKSKNEFELCPSDPLNIPFYPQTKPKTKDELVDEIMKFAKGSATKPINFDEIRSAIDETIPLELSETEVETELSEAEIEALRIQDRSLAAASRFTSYRKHEDQIFYDALPSDFPPTFSPGRVKAIVDDIMTYTRDPVKPIKTILDEQLPQPSRPVVETHVSTSISAATSSSTSFEPKVCNTFNDVLLRIVTNDDIGGMLALSQHAEIFPKNLKRTADLLFNLMEIAIECKSEEVLHFLIEQINDKVDEKDFTNKIRLDFLILCARTKQVNLFDSILEIKKSTEPVKPTKSALKDKSTANFVNISEEVLKLPYDLLYEICKDDEKPEDLKRLLFEGYFTLDKGLKSIESWCLLHNALEKAAIVKEFYTDLFHADDKEQMQRQSTISTIVDSCFEDDYMLYEEVGFVSGSEGDLEDLEGDLEDLEENEE
jgi:hypothetical protein